MGKGNRNSQEKLQNQAAVQEKQLAKKNSDNKKKKSDKAIAAACIIFALVIAAVLVLNVLGEAGVFLRGTSAMEQGDVVVDSAMMTFFINEYITNWYNNYSAYIMYGLINVDLSRDLNDQKMTSTEASYMGDSTLVGTSWYDYFVNSAMDEVKMYVTYAAAANAAGVTLNAEDTEEIDETVDMLKDSLRAYGMSFADQYGKGVAEKDVRNCYELIYLATNYSEYKQEELKNALDTDAGEDKILTYIDENKSSFYSADYLSYTIDVNSKGLTDEAYDDLIAIAKAEAEKIAEAKTPADFVALVEAYENKDASEEETNTDAETGTDDVTEEETKDPIEEYKGTLNYETSDELGKWLFEETAEENAVKVIEETGTATETTAKEEKETEESDDSDKTYQTFKITVYMVLKEADLNRANTHNMAYLIADNKEAAEKLLKEFAALQTKSGEKFQELAEAHYEVLHSGHDHSDENATEPVFSYSNVEQAPELYFAESYGALNEWLDAEERKAGDYTDKLIEITVDKTTYYCALYFDGQDDPTWHVNAFNSVLSEDIDAWYQGELDKKLITVNTAAIADIDLIKFYNTSAS
jgi:hypothetical protein